MIVPVRRTLLGSLLAVPLVAMLPGMAAATEATAGGPIAAEQVWSRPTTNQAKAAAAFLTLRNAGTAADTLVAAESPVAGRTELHTHLVEDGIARMRRVEGGIAVPAGETVALQPGGLHVMLLDLKRPLAVGDSFPLTLTFDKAGAMEVTVTVKAPGEEPKGGPGGHGHNGHHGH